jgi:hypothetical protein
MQSTEVGRKFLARVSEYLVSLPFDLKILQEAVADPDLERSAREAAAGVLLNALIPQEGGSPERYVDDALWLRIALGQILKQSEQGNEGASAFSARFEEVFATLKDELKLFEEFLGPELWTWLSGKLASFSRCTLKGKRVAQYVDDETTWDSLYEDGLDFQTNYDVTEEKVQNRLRRPEQLLELLQKRHAEDSKKRG